MESLLADSRTHKLRFKNLPDVYIEKTPPTFRVSPQSVKLYQGLSKRWTTLGLFHLVMHVAGFFMVYNLHRQLHYQEDWARCAFINK